MNISSDDWKMVENLICKRYYENDDLLYELDIMMIQSGYLASFRVMQGRKAIIFFSKILDDVESCKSWLEYNADKYTDKMKRTKINARKC